MQLWNGAALVAETQHIFATLTNPLVTLGGFPRIFSCPGIGSMSLGDTNPIIVLGGLGCPLAGCTGTELRLIAEIPTGATPPVAFTALDCFINANMDEMIYGLQTTPACSPVPINVHTVANGLLLDWSGDGFRLQGAETLSGPWYDLGVNSPVNLPANSTRRFFRLLCD